MEIAREKKIHISRPIRKNARKLGIVTRKMYWNTTKYMTIVMSGFISVHATPRYVPRDLTLMSVSTRYLTKVR